ncbi:MAG: hypothetical protein NXI04_20455 [Planctomycetaceae bacterium]|nr:hypothetical protein [Planctomycetaceae bacterium]
MSFEIYLAPFDQHPQLQQRVRSVLTSLPEHVQQDFVTDERFGVALDNYEPGKGWTLFMPTPGPPGHGSRRVVLKPRLNDLPEDFSLYVIAHEFAHAFLRNGGWGEITDPEDAADALAATWGYPRPATSIRSLLQRWRRGQ